VPIAAAVVTPNQRHGDAWACVIKGAVVEKPLGEVQVSEAAELDCVSRAEVWLWLTEA